MEINIPSWFIKIKTSKKRGKERRKQMCALREVLRLRVTMSNVLLQHNWSGRYFSLKIIGAYLNSRSGRDQNS